MNNLKSINDEQVKNSYNYVYFLGELTTAAEIINEVISLFQEINKVKIIIFHTLVTFEKAKEIRENILNSDLSFQSVKLFLIPATEYMITRYIVRDYDAPNTIIRIRGGSWINAIAISAEVKESKIIFNPSSFFKYYEREVIPDNYNIRCVFCNELIPNKKIEVYNKLIDPKATLVCFNPECEQFNQETNAYTDNEDYRQDFYLNKIDELEYREPEKNEIREVPNNWELDCLICDNTIKNYRLIFKGDHVYAFPICGNNECENFSQETIAYTKAPKGTIFCIHCDNEIKSCKVKILEPKQTFQLQYYCRVCKKDHRRITYKDFNDN